MTGDSQELDREQGQAALPRVTALDPLAKAYFDLATSERALAQSIEAYAFLESVLNASNDCIKVLTLNGDLIFMNDGGKVLMEVEDFAALHGCPWLGFWEGEGRAAAEAALAAARAGGTGNFQGAAATAKGKPKYWDVTVTLIPGADGSAGHVLSISRDITQARDTEAHRELLSRELSHRVKNSLAVAQAIAMQTFRGTDPEKLSDYSGRLAALGAAQDLLLQASWQRVPVRDVVESALTALCPDGRCRFTGEAYPLSAQRGLSLALALHELGTNAVKYGALSNDRGTIEVAWSVVAEEFRLTWSESDGPPVAPPSHTGFGTRLVTRNLEADFDGKVNLNYLPSGVVLTLTAPA